MQRIKYQNINPETEVMTFRGKNLKRFNYEQSVFRKGILFQFSNLRSNLWGWQRHPYKNKWISNGMRYYTPVSYTHLLYPYNNLMYTNKGNFC